MRVAYAVFGGLMALSNLYVGLKCGWGLGVDIAAVIRAEFTLTCKLIADIKKSVGLLDADRTLQRSIALRNPYVDPMNLMQIDLLRRWRAGGRVDPELFEALLASVIGIGAGLQTTG